MHPTTSERRGREGLDPGLLVGTTEQEILGSFLALVQSWRGGGQVSELRLRQADIAVLVAILGTDGAEIERRLVAATACSPSAARRGRRLLVAGVGAIVIGLLAAPVAATSSQAPALDVGDARPAASAGSAIRAGAIYPFDLLERRDIRPPAAAATPVAVPPDAVAATAQARPDEAPADVPPARPTGTVAVVAIPSLGIDLPVVAGGQTVIDTGVVAHYIAPGWEPPVPPGAPGTYWLAAHRFTHGAPFVALPDIAVGAEIRVATSNQTFIYTVTSVAVVGLWPGDDAIYGSDPAAPTILLQTCIDDTRRFLVRGTLSATL